MSSRKFAETPTSVEVESRILPDVTISEAPFTPRCFRTNSIYTRDKNDTYTCLKLD